MGCLPFKPAWWLPGPHLQTLWPTFCRRPIKTLSIENERLELQDGDFLDLAWVGKQQSGPIILLLHGLEGSVNSPYVQGMLNAIHQRHWRGVLMHFRGCSGEPNRLSRSYHSGDTQDFDRLVEVLKTREPQVSLAAVGFSLGGNVLLKWLGESKQNASLKAAAAVSVPYELHKASDRIQQGLSRFYEKHFLKCLDQRLAYKFILQPPPIELPPLSEIKSMWEFDEKVTAPLHGFTDARDYYSQSSSRQFLNKIQVPTLLIHSKDDPFMSPDIIPGSHELSECVKLEVTESGGHVGFISGHAPWRAHYWLEERIPDFLKDFI